MLMLKYKEKRVRDRGELYGNDCKSYHQIGRLGASSMRDYIQMGNENAKEGRGTRRISHWVLLSILFFCRRPRFLNPWIPNIFFVLFLMECPGFST